MRKAVLALLLGILLTSVHPAAAAVTYLVGINTSPRSGLDAYLDLQFVRFDTDNDGNRDPASPLNATITNFATDGTLNGPAQYDGAQTTGTLTTTLSFGNVDDFNAVLQRLTLGSSISFNLTFDGPGLNPGAFGTTGFGIALYDAVQFDQGTFAPILTTDQDGIAGSITFTGGTASTFTPAGTAGGPPTVTFTAVPEPATLASLTPGLVLMAGLLRRRSSARRHAG